MKAAEIAAGLESKNVEQSKADEEKYTQMARKKFRKLHPSMQRDLSEMFKRFDVSEFVIVIHNGEKNARPPSPNTKV